MRTATAWDWDEGALTTLGTFLFAAAHSCSNYTFAPSLTTPDDGSPR